MARKLLPTEITVFGRDVAIEEINDLYVDGEKSDGSYSASRLTISIEKKLEKEEKYIALLHELGHAMFDRLLSSSGISDEMEELIVDNLAVLMSETFTLKLRKKK